MSVETQPEAQQGQSAQARRVIKRYSNRKLYDTTESRYVTLAQIAEFVRAGEEVQVIDNATKEDKTEATLALILSEEVKTRPKAVPLGTLRDLVHTRGEKLITQLREGPLGRFFSQEGTANAENPVPEAPPVAPPPPEPPPVEQVLPPVPPASRSALQQLVESSRHTIEQWQEAIDERIQAILPSIFRDLQGEAKRLSQRVEELEQRVKELESNQSTGSSPRQE